MSLLGAFSLCCHQSWARYEWGLTALRCYEQGFHMVMVTRVAEASCAPSLTGDRAACHTGRQHMLSWPEGEGRCRFLGILLKFNHGVSMKVQGGAYWDRELVATCASILEGHTRNVDFFPPCSQGDTVRE